MTLLLGRRGPAAETVVLHRDDVLLRAEHQASPGNRRRGQNDFAKRIHREDFELRTGTDDRHLAALGGEIELAIGSDWRAEKRVADAALVHELSGFCRVAAQHA